MNNSIWLMLLLQAVLIGLNAVFATAEIAMISINDNKLARMAAHGDKTAVKLEGLMKQPARFLATIQVAITLSGFLGSAFAADNFAGMLTDWVIGLGASISYSTMSTISVILITLILSYFTLVFGELVPKRMAMRNSEKLALRLTGLIYGVSKAFKPIVSLLTSSTNGILRMFGIDPNAEDEEVSEEDIRMLVDVGSEKGVIDKTEKAFIQNVFEFDDMTAGEIATHRTDTDILWTDEPEEDWQKLIFGTFHTYYPVCDDTVDDVVGVLNSKDYFRLENKSRENVMKNAVEPAYFVPENQKADILFQNMKKDRKRFAIVLDEYGGTVGIITMKDLIEELVGDISMNEENRDTEIRDLGNGFWRIGGDAELEDVEHALHVRLPVDDYETFGGFVFGRLGSIPADGSRFDLRTDGLLIKVKNVIDHQVETAVVSRDKAEKPEKPAGKNRF